MFGSCFLIFPFERMRFAHLYASLFAYALAVSLVRPVESRAPGHPLVVQYQDMRNPHPFGPLIASASSQQQQIVSTKRLRIIAAEEPAMFTLTFTPPEPPSSPQSTANNNNKKHNPPPAVNYYDRNGDDAEDARGDRPEMATGHHFRPHSNILAAVAPQQQNATFKSYSVDEVVTVQSDEPLPTTTQRYVDEESFFTVAPTNYYYYDADISSNNKQQRNARRHHHHLQQHLHQPTLPASFDWLQDDDFIPPSAVTKKSQNISNTPPSFGKMVYDYKQHRRYRRRVIHQQQPQIQAKYRQSDDMSPPFWNKVDNSAYSAVRGDEEQNNGDDDDDDFVVIAPPRGLESFYSRYVIDDDQQQRSSSRRGEKNNNKQSPQTLYYEDDDLMAVATQQQKHTTARMMAVSTSNPHSKRSGKEKPASARYRHAAVQIPKTLASHSYNGMATVYSDQTSSNGVIQRITTTAIPSATTSTTANPLVLRPPLPPNRPNFDAPISTFTVNDLPLSECCSGFSAQLLQLILGRVDQQQQHNSEQQQRSPHTKIIPTVRLLQARLDDDEPSTYGSGETATTNAPIIRNAQQADYLTVQPTTPPTTFFHSSSSSSRGPRFPSPYNNTTAKSAFIVKPGYNVHIDGQFHLQWANWLRRQQRQVLHTLSQSGAPENTETDKSHHQNATTTYMPHISGNLFTRREIRPWKDQIALLEPIVQSHLLTILPVQLVRRIEQLLLTGDGLDDLIGGNNEKQQTQTARHMTPLTKHNWLRNAQRKFATMSSACDLVALQELLEVRARTAYNIQSPAQMRRSTTASETERRQARQNALNEQRPVTILPNNRLNTYLLDINFVLVKHPLWPKIKKVESLRKVANHIRKQSVHNTFTLSTLDGVKRMLTAPQPRLVPATTHDPLPREQYLVLLGDSLSVQPFIAAHRNSLVVIRELGESPGMRSGASVDANDVATANFYRHSSGIELQDYSFVISKGYSQLRVILDGAIKSLTNGSLLQAGGVRSTDTELFSPRAAQTTAKQLFDIQQQWLFPLSVEFFNLSRVLEAMRSSRSSNGNGFSTSTRFDAQNGLQPRYDATDDASSAQNRARTSEEDDAFAVDADAAISCRSSMLIVCCCFLSTSFTFIYSFCSCFVRTFVHCTQRRRRLFEFCVI